MGISHLAGSAPLLLAENVAKVAENIFRALTTERVSTISSSATAKRVAIPPAWPNWSYEAAFPRRTGTRRRLDLGNFSVALGSSLLTSGCIALALA